MRKRCLAGWNPEPQSLLQPSWKTWGSPAPQHTHIHPCQVENVGHIPATSVAKFRQGTDVVSGPGLLSEYRAPCCTTQRQLVRGGRREEREGRERERQRKGCGRAAFSPRGRRVSSAWSRSRQSELGRRLRGAAPAAERPLASLSQDPSGTFWDQALRQNPGRAGAYLLARGTNLGHKQDLGVLGPVLQLTAQQPAPDALAR